MAGGGSGEEENYWPGFVDALTTMTMVLTFIMMILGVVIFSMSQNVSKQLISQIAEAAKIEIKGGGSAEDVKNQIIVALKASKAEKEEADEKEELRKDQQATQLSMRGDNAAMPAPSKAPSAKTKLPSPTQNSEQDTGVLAGLAKNAQPTITDSDGRKMAPPPSPIQEAPGKAEPDKRIDSSSSNDTAPPSSGFTLEASGSILTITFKKRVIQLDAEAVTEFNGLVTSSRIIRASNTLEVRGFADVTVLGVTEARRIAYYRTMLVRKQLIASGYSPDKIIVRIEDAPATDSDIVRVYAK